MNMKVNIAGVEWKNPVTVASGTFGSGAEFARRGKYPVGGESDTESCGNVRRDDECRWAAEPGH